MSEKKSRRRFPRDFKIKIAEEYISGALSAQEIAEREGIPIAFIYRWKTFFEEQTKLDRLSDLESEGHSAEDARKIRDLEEELEAYKVKVAELTLHNDLLKKVHPSFQSERKSSGYVEIKRKLAPLKGRAK